ncbi:MAG: 4-(cytidine 5'-diphospho)-2-C-methyl-D-erythritol kinase [Syntrophales bacterium]|nr:4-(cytidine 5'-diphospho)-2-C-methyl-D-erythritol kinase [Syntrophales bacterium]
MIRRLSPAKINLHLKVLRKREDGYHDLSTLMQPISLYDEMTFTPADRGITLRCPDHPLLENRDNIVYRAAEMIIHKTSWPRGIEIILEKHIPVAAGLGGGSSNAATTLLTLNEIMGSPFDRENLMKMGAKLGADVPFFIFEHPAWASGIGDRLVEASNLPPLFFLLINPGFELSTKTVYEKLNFTLTKEPIHYSIPRFLNVHDVIKGLHNDLEKVSMKLYPVIGKIKGLLLSHGALGALMSGSGPTVFGVFHSEEETIQAEDALKEVGGWTLLRAHSV